jgi:tetratricopeptide (TPR) repeat protein
VFHAKEASRGRRGRNWVVVGLVPLLLLCILGAVVFVYWDSIAAMVFDQPVATRQPPPRPVQPAPDPVPQPSTTAVAPAVVVAEAQPSAAGTSAPSPSAQAPGTAPSTAPSTESQAGQAPATTSTGAGTTATGASAGQAVANAGETPRPSPQPTMTELAATAPTVAQVTRTTDDSGRRLSADEQVAREIQRRGLAPASLGDGTAFKITRRSTPDKLHPRLARAYAAWIAGDLVAAKRDYARVLKSNPRNRNALLGLGAIAVREDEWDAASRYYKALLTLNPKDSIAQAGIIAIHENVDPLRGESQIKLLLREEPEAPHLHFTLGNMYADQRRWGEAQIAYFDAYRLQSDNADYAYNLAVSLDQLGQAKAAGDYYRQALDLAAQHGAVFDQPGVRDRLLKLAFEDAAQ